MWRPLSLIVFIVHIQLIASTCNEANNNSTNAEVVRLLTKGVNDFAFKFLQYVLKTNKGQNVIMSPYSAQLALSQLGPYTKGESLNQLLDAFGLENKDQIAQGFQELVKTLIGGNGVTFTQNVKSYANDKYPLSDNFLQYTKDVFNATAENIDCSNPEKAAATINKWVEDNTNNLIKNLIPKDVINNLVRMILVNAIYFKGTWKKEFNKNNTEDRDFYVNKDTVKKVPTMYQQAKLNYTYSEELNAQVLELRYVNENFRFIIVLPSEIEGLQDVASKLNADSIKKALDSMTTQDVKVWLPSFKIETSLDLKEVLQGIDVTDIFIPGKSGIEGVLKKDEDLYVSSAVHKAVIEVNEEGSEAAAATGLIVGVTSVHIPVKKPEVRCDHPFIYSIVKDGVVLFMGSKSV